MTHICGGNLTIIGSDNGLSPCRRQAIIWTNAGILLIGPWGTNFSEILIGIQTFSFKKMHLKMSSGKRRPFCLGLNVLRWRLLKIFSPQFSSCKSFWLEYSPNAFISWNYQMHFCYYWIFRIFNFTSLSNQKAYSWLPCHGYMFHVLVS